MQPLRITAHLLTPLAAFDDWSPALDSILEMFWLMERGLYTGNPNPEQIIKSDLPIQEGNFEGEWYWCCSSPCYLIEFEQSDRLRKRWDMQEHHLDWQGKKQKWSSSEGHTKSMERPLYYRTTPSITWFAVGEPTEILHLLQMCSGLGFKRHCQVYHWDVTPFDADWHLWGPQGQLMRPIPRRFLPTDRPVDFRPLRWGWRPPYRMTEFAEDCALPVHTVKRLSKIQSA